MQAELYQIRIPASCQRLEYKEIKKKQCEHNCIKFGYQPSCQRLAHAQYRYDGVGGFWIRTIASLRVFHGEGQPVEVLVVEWRHTLPLLLRRCPLHCPIRCIRCHILST
jgi:hypothetical protein